MKKTLSCSMRSRCLFIYLLSLISLKGFSQESNYPKDYFRNPLDIPILLAGNFGECRPNHFHSGIDIKTQARENLVVRAAADGYVSRIKMEKGGFGHALYVTHPNGYTTLYAHLNDFAPELQRYMKKKQYEKESWALDIALDPKQFPVKKGEQIAWSGNTGSSTAPHLHFEIRDTKTEHPLNPQLFGFDIKDTRAPVPVKLSVYDMRGSIYDGEQEIVNLKKKGAMYTADTIEVLDKAAFGICVNDYMDGSANTLNFYTATWYMDDSLQGSIRLDDIGYDVTRYLHAYVDYSLKKRTGEWYQLLFRQPGNMLMSLYPVTNDRSGIFIFTDLNPHKIRIELQDVYGNTTTVSFVCQPTPILKSVMYFCKTELSWNKVNKFETPNLSFELDEKALYDNICFKATSNNDQQSFSDRHIVGNSHVPVHTYFDLKIKPNKLVPFALRDKVVMKYSDGKSDDGRAALPDSNGWYKAAVRNFGTYWLVADTTAPYIEPLQKDEGNLSKATMLRFLVKEELTSVKKFRAELDGKWLCFEPKGNTFIYKFDERCPKGLHKLVVTAADENGNERRLVYTFTR